MASNGNKIELVKKIAVVVSAVSLLVILGSTSYHFGFSSGTKYERDNNPPVALAPVVRYVQVPAEPDTLGESTSMDEENEIRRSKSATIISTESLDGYRSSKDKGSSRREIRVGRNYELVTRGFLSFDITSLPQSAEIESAELRVYQAQVIGFPYKIGRKVLVDHLNFGNELNSADYGASALVSNFGEISDGEKTEWKTLDVTSAVSDDIENARATSQYRLHMESELTGGDPDGDFAMIESSENFLNSGKRPQLVIKYLQ